MRKVIAVGITVGLALAALLGTGIVSITSDASGQIGSVPERSKADSKVINRHTAPNLVDFSGGFYAGEVSVPLKLDTRDISESTPRNFVDWNDGLYAGTQ